MLDQIKRLLGVSGASHGQETDSHVTRVLPERPFATALLAALDSAIRTSGNEDPTRRVPFVHTSSLETDLAAAAAGAAAGATVSALCRAGIDWPEKETDPTAQFTLAVSFGFLVAAVLLLAIKEEGFVVERDDTLRPFLGLLLANLTDADKNVVVRQAHRWAIQLLADQHPKLVEWRENLSILARAMVLRETNQALKQHDLNPALGSLLSTLVNAWEPHIQGETVGP